MKFECTFTMECRIYVALLPSPQTAGKITTLHLDWGMTITTHHNYNSSNRGIFISPLSCDVTNPQTKGLTSVRQTSLYTGVKRSGF